MSEREFQNEDFDPEKYIEMLAWEVHGGKSKTGPESFDPNKLFSSFEKKIEELNLLSEKTRTKIDGLEESVQEEGSRHTERTARLLQRNKKALGHFHDLDEKINFVATKVVHLGDQLESVNAPRQRAVEAQKIMTYFNQFLTQGPRADIFTDPFQLAEAADIILKLSLIAHELPDDRFKETKARIETMYKEIEQGCIEEFSQAYREGEGGQGDVRRMKEMAAVLLPFRGYSDCIDAFIAISLEQQHWQTDIFAQILPLCTRVNRLAEEVFLSGPENVMGSFVHNLYTGVIGAHVSRVLDRQDDKEAFLKNLYGLYSKSSKLCSELQDFKLGSDNKVLAKLTKEIFSDYLDRYTHLEVSNLKEKMTQILDRYYQSIQHQRKQAPLGGIQELKQDLQAKLLSRTNISLGTSPPVDHGGQTFLSQEVAISLLQESKQALTRCQMLSAPSEVPDTATMIFDVLMGFLCSEHIDYALELGLQGIAQGEIRSAPNIYFFDVVGESNAIFHLLEKQFSEILLPIISSSAKHGECVQKKREVMELMEAKVDTGLDRTLWAIIGWIKYVLSVEQKKTDFRPESQDAITELHTPACGKVVGILRVQTARIRKRLDGKNVDTVLTELGVRFHRLVYDHLQLFTYNSLGGMMAICDLNEYRKCVKTFNVALVSSLFEMLHSLCNLLVVVPENLKTVTTGEQLGTLDRSLVLSFLQLRQDYKTAKVFQLLK